MSGQPHQPVPLDRDTLTTVGKFYETFAHADVASGRFDRTFETIADALQRTFGAAHVIVWAPDPEAGSDDDRLGRGRLNPAYTTFSDETLAAVPASVPMASSRIGRAFTEGQARFYADLEDWTDPVTRDLLQAAGLAGMWAIPLTPMVQRLGPSALNPHNVLAVALASFPPNAWVAAVEPAAFEFFGRICGRAIERALWTEQDLIGQKAYEAIDIAADDPHAAMNSIAQVIKECMQFEACSVLQADGVRRVLHVLGTTGIDSRVPQRKMSYPYGVGCTGWVADRKRIFATEDLTGCEQYVPARFPEIVTSDQQQFLGAPLLSNGGGLLGVIRLRNKLAPAGHAGPRGLNYLDRMRIQRVARLIAPLMSLLIKERQVTATMERIRHDLTMPAMAIRDGAGMLLRETDQAFAEDLARIRQKLEDIESFGEVLLLNSDMMGITPETDLKLRVEHIMLLGGFIAKLCKMLRPEARRRGLSGILYNQGSFMSIQALWLDPALFQIALYNLLQNALKYSERGSVIIVEGDSARIDGEVWHQIHVKNTGIGITAEEASHIFDRHWRSPRARRRSDTGLGIGLATARGIVQRHGGRLVLSRPDDPTIFTIQLPSSLATEKPG